MSNSIHAVLRRIEKKLKRQDILRTDLRFADLLNKLPAEFVSLLPAIAGLRAYDANTLDPELHDCLDKVDLRLSELSRLLLDEELREGVRGIFSTERDAEALFLRMGWTDGELHTHEDVARSLEIAVDEVQACEKRARLEIEHRGLYCPKLTRVMREIGGSTPRSDKQLAFQFGMKGLSNMPWEGRALLATADLVGIRHELHVMRIWGMEYLTRLTDETYPTRVLSHARRLTTGGRRATLDEVASAVAADIKQPVHRRDVRIVVMGIRGVKFHDQQLATFGFKRDQ